VPHEGTKIVTAGVQRLAAGMRMTDLLESHTTRLCLPCTSNEEQKAKEIIKKKEVNVSSRMGLEATRCTQEVRP
jgi:hypothetical protein